MNLKRSMGKGCRALVMVVGIAFASGALTAHAAGPFDVGGSSGKKDPLYMVMPYQCLPTMQLINRSLNFNKVSISQAAIGSNIMQTAVVDVSQMGGKTPGTMFVPYGQLGPIQQLNKDLNINVVDVTQFALGNNIQQVALVTVSQSNSSGSDPYTGGGQQQGGSQQQGGQQQGGQQQGGQQQGGQQQGGDQQQGGGDKGKGDFLVAPLGDVPTLQQLNKSLNFNVVKISQTAVGDNNSQSAIVSVNQDNSGGSSGGMTPVFLPYNQLGAYKALNLNLNINIVTITQIAIGNQIQQVALALISQKN